MNKYFCVFALLFASALAIAAEPTLECRDDENFLTSCLERSTGFGIDNERVEALTKPDKTFKDDLTATMLSSLQELVTGTSAGGAATSREDFLSMFALNLPDMGDGVQIDGENPQSDQTFDIEWNLPMCVASEGNCLKLTLAVARDPDVNEAILESVSEADRAMAKSALSSGLNSFDDYTVGFKYSYQGKLGKRRIGRSPEHYFPAIQAIHALALVNQQANLPTGNRQEFLDELKNQGIVSDEEFRSLLTTDGFYNLLTDFKKTLIEERFKIYFADSLSAATFDPIGPFLSAIDNQPQLIVAGSLRKRDDRIGADERTLSIRYEMPLGHSFNSMERDLRSHCAQFDGVTIQRSDNIKELAGNCIAHLNQTLNNAYDEGWRAAFSLEYKDIDDQSVMLASPMLNFMAPGSDSLTISASLGRRFPARGSLSESHFDLEASHEDVSDDPMRNNRTKISATWAFKFGEATIPISVVYANHPEFDLTDVDQQISAQIGIKYDINQLFGQKP